MLRIARVAVALASVSTAAAAQENLFWPPTAEPEMFTLKQEINDTGFITLGAAVRVSSIKGGWVENTPADDPDFRYEDIFKRGFGFRLELSGYTKQHQFWGGAYVAVGSDTYDGDRAESQGIVVTTDDMNVRTAFFGVKGVFPIEDIAFVGAYVGGGPMLYSDVDATVNGIRGNLFQESSDYTFEAGVRGMIKIGPLLGEGGFDVRHMGDPHQGHGFTILSEPRQILSVGFLIGGSIAF